MKKNIMVFVNILFICSAIINIIALGSGVIELLVDSHWICALASILFILISLLIGSYATGILFEDIKDKLNEVGDEDDI